jgi:hypothetical protein
MRLHELAKEINADSKRLLAIAKELGLGNAIRAIYWRN